MWIEELQRELDGRLLDIWRGHTDDGTPIDMDPAKAEQYRALWRREAALGRSRPRGVVRQSRPPGGCGCKGPRGAGG